VAGWIYRYFAGRIIARHICATGLLSNPRRPPFGGEHNPSTDGDGLSA
jgi:hypothetical protein